MRKPLLLPLTGAKFFLGKSSEDINALIDDGTLVGVWDFGGGQRKLRELRFLAEELQKPGRFRGASFDQVSAIILPKLRERVRATEIGEWWMLTRPTVWRLVRKKELAGPLVGHCQFITRVSAEKYLRRRWLGAVQDVASARSGRFARG